jgi:chromosome partitioning protein
MRASIAIANHKGGVGKTVTAVNLAGRLAKAGYRTLLVDVDAQAHATLWFADDVDYDLQDIVMGGVPLEKVIVKTRIEGLDLLPATLSLAQLELQMVALPLREFRIQKALKPARDEYDYIVMDLPPGLTVVALGALVAATHVVAPVSATKLAMAAFGTFCGWLDDFRAQEVVTATLLGALVTMVDPRTRTSREVILALANNGYPVFNAQIPRRVGVEDQVTKRELATGPVGEAYDEFANEVIFGTGTGTHEWDQVAYV